MNLIKAITRNVIQTSVGTEITVTALIDRFYERSIDDRLVPVIVEKLAEEFIKQRGEEVLKRLSDQTIDAKVIQKVVANLRKELKEKA